MNRLNLIVGCSFLLLAVIASPATAQTDSVAIPAPRVADTDSLRPPITPGRAFLRSLLLPGSSQNKLGRNKVGAGIIAVEVISIGMIRESGFGVREARRQSGDSLVISYVDANGARLVTPVVERRRFGEEEIRSRRSHVEDWVALLIANHLFAAADAFVAANLWDVKARVTVNDGRNAINVGASIPW